MMADDARVALGTLKIPRPYLLFLGDMTDPLDQKTAAGIHEWRPEWCAGQFRLTPETNSLGLIDMNPEQAVSAGARTMVIGTATFGGRLPDAWEDIIVSAMQAGLDIASGLHDRLSMRPRLAEAAKQLGRNLFDVRGLPREFNPPVGSGRSRTGNRLLTVGTDCAVGKKFTALSIERDMRAQEISSTFRATGQTGLLISGGGVAIDSVVSDFLAGVVEMLSPDNLPDHWDVIEGQGSLFHPAYAAVSLGLLHGSQPDAFVVCHEAGRQEILGYPDFAIPRLEECIELTIALGRRVNPAIRCVGISLNTASLSERARADALSEVERQVGLPCIDPAITGTSPIINNLGL
jgi:uncharacterized NAD-dependent epimerase/dehydratase family protein